ncbi:MAG: lysylphosphatidylglycerol synthase transmembrane domain-containing protein [Chloroflexi bacterium]|nr:lysylphosphatidylglycerol synthase transmembrane domain-containing protein [Chloroflexota bacterium]PKB57094.1 MAG: hypothetical protein BZY73_04995 [SAR202 cluster bacterium Casp-Chloro-G3]
MTSRKLLLLILLAVLVFVGLAAYGDIRNVGQRIASFPIHYLSVAIVLALLNYLLRFLRWCYYLRVLKIEIPLQLSLLVFLSGLTLSMTPGKVGELVKGYFLRNRAGVRLSSSIPAILMERLTDVVAVVLMGLVGLALLPVSIRWILIVVLTLSGFLTWFLVSKHNERLFQLPVLRRWRDEVQLSREGLRRLTAPRPMLVAVSLGVLAWLSEGLAFWLVLIGLNSEVSALQSLPIYASATIAGAITTLPGGLIGTEGTMLALLQQSGVARDAASTATLLIRLVTLWLAVGIGMIALVVLNRYHLVVLKQE